MKITLCQLDPVMGDVAGNTARVCETVRRLAATDAPDLAVFPELFIQGYPPRDLLDCAWFVRQGEEAVTKLAALSAQFPDVGILTGCALPTGSAVGAGLHNSAVLVCDGAVVFRQNKSLLPSYDVFDETRYFDPASSVEVFRFKGETLGITVCEDAWNHAGLFPRRRYGHDPVEQLAAKGATLLLNISGSPFHAGKQRLRGTIVQQHARRHRLPFIFVNQVGGNDELIFDGNSMAFDAAGGLRQLLPAFEESVVTVDTAAFGPPLDMPSHDTVANIHDALVLGVRDYARKCGFKRLLVGLSGGIDSAVTACLAVAAVGADNVTGVTMPSRFSSEGSVEDSRVLAQRLGIDFKTIPIETMHEAFLGTMRTAFEGRPAGVAEENMQARIRGSILMALSNKFGCLLLTTGNKSEMSVGYCTLYGDMNGGLAVIADLPKAMVYQVARHINRNEEIIPAATITKPPSAELRPGQKDQDTLPDYGTLDAILALLIEEGRSRRQIVDAGHDAAAVDWILRAVRTSEYKRRQAAPGLKVTPKAFGSGRRFPVAARYDFS